MQFFFLEEIWGLNIASQNEFVPLQTGSNQGRWFLVVYKE